MPSTDDWGGVAVNSQPQPDDWGGIPVTAPKVPDTSGVTKMAQENLAANDNKDEGKDQEKAFQDIVSKPIETPQERLDTAAGMPVQKIINGSAQPSDINAANRKQYVSAIKDGSATHGADWMQTALFAVSPVAAVAAHIDPVDVGKTVGSSLAKLETHLLTSTPPSFLSDVIQGTVNLPVQGATRLAGAAYEAAGGELSIPTAEALTQGIPKFGTTPGQLALRGMAEEALDYKPKTTSGRVAEATVGIAPYIVGGEGTLAKKAIGSLASGGGTVGASESAKEMGFGEKGQAVSGILGGFPGMMYGAGPVREHVAKKNGIPPEAVTPDHIDSAIAAGSKDLYPAAKDFKDVETVTGGALKEETLHTIYVETGVRPEQVFEDARNDPQVAQDVSEGKVPEAYEHLVEPKVISPEKSEKLTVAKSDTGKAFNVVDEQGDFVQGGFESAEEARHYIEDKKVGTIPDEPPEWSAKGPVMEKTSTKSEPPIKDGMVRLYRAEPKQRGNAPEWVKRGQDESGHTAAEGRWFTADKEKLEWYKDDVGPNHKVTYIDVPKEEAAKYLVAGNAEAGRFSKDPASEYFVSPEMAAKRGDIEAPATKKTASGEQTVLPGAEKITDKQLAERKMEEPKKAAVAQKAPDEGLFDTGAQRQTDLMDVKPEAKAAEPVMTTHEVAIKEPVRLEPTLPKELSGAKPRYGYGDKQFTLKFESDIDRAAYIAAQEAKKSKADSRYVDFLKSHGFDDAAIAELGAKVKDSIKAMAKDAKPGELTVKSQRGETPPTIEKSQKHLTKDTVPPSTIGKPTSLYTFIKNNGGIKPSVVEGGDLKSAGHKDLLNSKGKNIDDMRAMAEEHGYVPEGLSVPEFQAILQDSDGGRTHFRDADSERLIKAEEARQTREQNDPVRLEHEASQLGLDTEKAAGETDKQYAARLLKSLRDFYSNESGTARVRDAAGNWILKKPIEAVEKWAGKLTGGIFEKLGEGYIKTFQPELMGDKALRADSFLAKYKAVLQEAENTYYRQSAKIKKMWDKKSHDERMGWLYDHETGRWSEALDPDHARYQALLDATFKAEKESIGADAEKGYKENYLPHLWENPDAVKEFFASDAMIKKYGKDGFTKASTFQLIQDGVREGYKLKTDNPEAMLVGRLLAGHNMIATMDLLKDMEGSGIAVPARAFSVDKRIGKLEREISEAEAKYKAASDKINDPKQLKWDFADPAVSKYMKGIEARLESLKSRMEDATKEKASYKNLDNDLRKNSFKIIGPDSKVWNIHNEVGPLWKNAMDSKGLWENQGVLGDAYRSYYAAKSNWVAIKLGLSLFHPIHVAAIHIASDVATMAEHLIQGGKFSELALGSSLRMGLTKETAKLNDHPAIQAWNTPLESRTPEQQYMVTKMVEGGFKPTMSARDTVHFRENFDKAISGLGPQNLRLIGTALQLPGKVSGSLFMEHWIPGLKAEIYDYRTELALKRDPSLKNDAGRRGEVFRQIAKDTDRTYGEMNQDVQFWNKTVRDSFNAAFISGGWKLAQLYNLKGLAQPLKIAGKALKTGEFDKADITYNMLQSYAYTAVTLATGAAILKMLGQPIAEAGDDAWDMVKNLVAPKTGEKNPDGTPIRLQQPAFAKEAYMLARDINTEGLISGTGSFIYGSTLIPGIKNTLNNRDFIGREIISDPTDLHQWMNAGWNAITPITVAGLDKAEQKDSDVGKTAQLLGFPLAGAYMNQTPFEQKVLYTYSEQNPPKGDVYSAKLKGDLRSAVFKGDNEAIDETKQRMREEGMSETDIHKAEKIFTSPFVDVAWDKLPAKDQKRLIESASEKEKQRFRVKQ